MQCIINMGASARAKILVFHLPAAVCREQKLAEETKTNYHGSDFYLIYLTGFY